MRKHYFILSVIGFILVIFSCNNNGNKNLKELLCSTKGKYSYEQFRSTMTSQAFINELDTSKWILHSYRFHPTRKRSFNMLSKDTLHFHNDLNMRKDLFSFQPSSGLIFKNDTQIGEIKKDKINYDTIKFHNGKKIGISYHTRFYIHQPNDSIMNGLFNVNYCKRQRLHLATVRTNNKTKEKDVIYLIFFKK